MQSPINFDTPLVAQPYRRSSTMKGISYDMFFLSFTDSLRYALQSVRKKNHRFLIPQFYCPETVTYLKSLGAVATYKTEDDLSIDIDAFFSEVQKQKPDVIMLYSLIGFVLSQREKENLRDLCPNALVIHDFAHRIVTAADIAQLREGEILIDSIRKYSPFLGSHLIGCKGSFRADRLNMYKLKAVLARMADQVVTQLNRGADRKWLRNLSDNAFAYLDSIIGEYPVATKGTRIEYALWNRLDTDRLMEHITVLWNEYTRQFSRLSTKGITTVPFSAVDSHLPIFFPVLVRPEIREGLVRYLQDHHIYAEQLWDGEGSDLYEKVIIFPLTYTTTVSQIERAAKMAEEYIRNNL